MPFDPCGRIVDYLRSPGTDIIRPFAARPDITVKREWYPCQPDAKPLGFESWLHPVNSWRQWVNAEGTVGPIYPQPTAFTKRKALERLPKDHFCGEEDWFTDGAPYDPDFDADRDADGIPACCGREPPPPPPPGLTCATAPVMEYDVDHTFPVASFGARYYELPLTDGTADRLKVTVINPPFVPPFFQVTRAATPTQPCTAWPVWQNIGSQSTGCFTITTLPAGTRRMLVMSIPVLGFGMAITVRAERGAC